MRTSPWRAVLLWAATMIPFLFAIDGPANGPVAGPTTLAVFSGAMVLLLVRPPIMHRLMAGAMGIVAAAFGLDALSSGQTGSLIGAGAALLVAVVMWRLKRPTWD